MNQTLLSMLRHGASLADHAPAMIERRGERYVGVSHADLSTAIDAAAQALAGLGVREGDVVAVWLPNGLDYLALEFAAAGLGAAVLGVNTRYGVFELTHILLAARPKVIALPGQFLDLDFAGRLAAAFADARCTAPDLPPLAILVCGGLDDPLAGPHLGAVAALDLHASSPTLPDHGQPDATVNYFTTSGSTGAPKLAGHDQKSIVIHSPLAARLFDIHSGDIVLGVLPFCGVFGFNIAMSALASGASLLVDPVFDARETCSAMARFGVTHAFGGDDFWGRLHEAWLQDRVSLSTLRRGAIAQFGRRAEPLAAWARDELGAELTGLYGSSELMSFVLTRPIQPDIAAQVRGGGRPISDTIEFRLADPETGEPADGAQGELQVRGYNRLTHYLGAAEATARAITPDGWYRTGDLVSDDGDGGFTFLCRNTEALRLRGFLVEPAEIEQCLLAHPAVAAARVVGVRTDQGDQPVGFVSLRSGGVTTPHALKAFCKDRLAAFKVPAKIIVLDALPVTAGTNGVKIWLEELKRLARLEFEPSGAIDGPI